jgi:hypothetical protein
MADEADEIADAHVHSEPVHHLAAERDRVGLSRLDTPTRKLPQEWEHGRRAPLGDEVPALFLDHRCDDSDRM